MTKGDGCIAIVKEMLTFSGYYDFPLRSGE